MYVEKMGEKTKDMNLGVFWVPGHGSDTVRLWYGIGFVHMK